jgi:hypothetical protein
MLDDDTTQSALRFLLQVDDLLEGGDEDIRGALEYGLTALLGVQYPVGAWSHNFDAYPSPGPQPADYPILSATVPEQWSRTWPKEWAGCYHLNDNITTDAIETLLLAHELRKEDRFLEGAKRGGEFLIRAQLPQPQPAWAQQYDKDMKPVWERKFEPPAVTGGESQGAMQVLVILYRATGEKRFLEPLKTALPYLRSCTLPNGRLARYYELGTNRPLYFDQQYALTYDGSDVPDHYSFEVGSRLDGIERRMTAALAGEEPPPRQRPTEASVRVVLAAQSASGLWLEPGSVRNAEGKKVTPKDGIVSSATFAKNLGVLAAYLKP